MKKIEIGEIRFEINETIKRVGYDNKIVGGQNLTIVGGVFQMIQQGGVNRLMQIANHKIYIADSVGEEPNELLTPYFTESDLTPAQIKELVVAQVITIPKGYKIKG